mmetsp:Transcript_42015/g.82390  ORF Transcript_42015/g.82390 Transcript_42015/m.82390 type:complete len:383 (-) Transcript_42015:1-1149(-)
MSEQNQHIWLGLLKWSLAYSDGTSPSDLGPMSEEKRHFLEAVMRDGVVDEVKRMKEIMEELKRGLSPVKKDENDDDDATRPDEGVMHDMLMELRDIIEQIDYAQTFAKVGGLPFLLGCAIEGSGDGKASGAGGTIDVPSKVRRGCLSVLAGLAQNNPPVQSELASAKAVEKLLVAYVLPPLGEECGASAYRSQLLRNISCIVRGDAGREDALVRSEMGSAVLLSALTSCGDGSDLAAAALRRRAAFLVRALTTSDDASAERLQNLRPHLGSMIDSVTDRDSGREIDMELRETSLTMLIDILQQKKNVCVVQLHQEYLVGAGVQRVAELRQLDGEEAEVASVELDLWENLILELARSSRDGNTSSHLPEEPLLMLASQPNPNE